MSSGLLRLKRARPLALTLSLVVSVAWLSGCGDTYSEAIQYTVRIDPLFTKAPTNEQLEPDRPGQFPLYSIEELQDVRNPLYKPGPELIKNGTIRDPAKLSDKNREQLDEVLTICSAHRPSRRLEASTRRRGQPSNWMARRWNEAVTIIGSIASSATA